MSKLPCLTAAPKVTPVILHVAATGKLLGSVARQESEWLGWTEFGDDMDALTGIEKLKALEEISLLKARRDRAADTKDWALYESLHAPDHVSENGDYGRWTSAVEMIANVRKSMENLVTMHHSHTPEIEFETPTRAKGIWAMTGLSCWKQGSEDHWFRAFGHYHETYEQRDGRWVFTSRALEYYHTMRSPAAIFPPKIDN